jgi:hypothetical protein
MIFMSTISAHERASVERRIRQLKDDLYRLALAEMPEGARVEKLRKLMAEIRGLESSTKSA